MTSLAAHLGDGKPTVWQLDISALPGGIEEARAMVAEAIKKETGHAPRVVLVGIQGGKQ